MTVDRLRDIGHDVQDIRGTAAEGLPDPDLWDMAIRGRRLLITTDKGFTEYRRVSHNGVLIIRLRRPNRLRIHQSVMHAIGHFQESEWPGLLVVVRDTTMSTSRGGGPVEK